MSETLRFDLLANDRASHVFNKVGDSADRTTDRFKNFAKVGALAAAGAAVLVGKALVDMTKAAVEDEAAQIKLANSLKNAAGASGTQVAATERWIEAQGKALGVADDELRPALGRLAVATGDVEKAQKLTGLAMDVSAGTGKSLSTVTEALAKAQNGSLGGLSRLGVATKDASGETKSLAAITKDLADVHGGQASAAAETTAGKYKRLQVQFDEVKETIGAKLIPVAEKLVGWLLDEFIPAVERFNRDHGPAIRNALEKIGEGFQDLGRLGKALWNNALQPAFKFIIEGVAFILDMWSTMLGVLGKVPGFGWATKAADAMAGAAEKARVLADNIKKIPDKTVNVTVAYKYTGLRAPGGSGPTRTTGNINDSILPRGQVETASFKLGQLIPEGFKGGMKSKIKVALEAVNELVSRAGDKLQTLKDKAADVMSGVASAMQGSLDLGNLGGTDSEGNRLNATDQLAAFAGQARDFAGALATAAANGINSGLISRIANMGPGMGLTAAQALAAMDQASVESANASLAAVDHYANMLGQTVLTTTSLPADIARAEGQLATLQEIRDDLKNNPRNINFTVNDATDPDAVVRAIRRYVNRNGKLRGLTKDD